MLAFLVKDRYAWVLVFFVGGGIEKGAWGTETINSGAEVISFSVSRLRINMPPSEKRGVNRNRSRKHAIQPELINVIRSNQRPLSSWMQRNSLGNELENRVV